MPALIEVGVRGLAGPGLPAQHGPGLHAAVLGMVRRVEPALAEQLHAGDTPRPYGLGPLEDGDHGLAFHLGWGTDHHLTSVVEAVNATSRFRVGRSRLAVERIDVVPVPWPTLLAAPPVGRWRLDVDTPLTLRAPSHDAGVRVTLPLPTPELLVQRLGRRWERLGGPTLPAPAETWANRVGVAEFQLESRPWLVRTPNVREIGAVGSLQLQLVGDHDDEAAAALGALLRFGELVGVGDHTTKGMGRIRAQPCGPPDRGGRNGSADRRAAADRQNGA